ncbi:hypothetical protein SKAU_G00151240 [Synaphobranchus kaupii]|uniref:Uncharacterized protein n=1 Tax=Synaphobranchus kaupii TaxID=118154 RepID=A0A9Q1FH06_SYNKA|nr:hypothetical protein SKAU_G00151240 [Synaphobranchus kaupii]
MAMTQECPEQRPAPLSGVIARPHQGALINNVQWVHIPVLVNLTAWSPDLDEHCKGESVTPMYKDLMTTAFLKYHNMVAADFQSDSPTPTPTGRKLLWFLDGVLGATGTGLVVCMAPACLYALPTMSGHAPDESADGVLGDLLPDLDQGISELLDSLWR